MIKKAEKNKVLTLRGNEDDKSREALSEGIINVISKEAPAYAVWIDVDVLSHAIACVRKDDEKPNEYASSYSGKVARCVNMTSMLTPVTSRLFDVMMLSISVLSVDTMKTIMYQLKMAKKEKSIAFW